MKVQLMRKVGRAAKSGPNSLSSYQHALQQRRYET